jgi:hypothetical protein
MRQNKSSLKKKHKVSVKPSKILLQLQIQALLPFFTLLLTSLVSTTSRIASFDIKKNERKNRKSATTTTSPPLSVPTQGELLPSPT